MFSNCFVIWTIFSVLGAIFTKYDPATQQFENNYAIYFILAFIPIDILVTRIPSRGMFYPLNNIVIGEATYFDVKEENNDSSIVKQETIVDVGETIKQQTEITKTNDINLENYYAITKIRKRRSFASSFSNYASLAFLYVITTLLFGIYFTNQLGIAAFCIEMTLLAFTIFYAMKFLIFVFKYKVFNSRFLPYLYVFLFLLLIAGSTLLGIYQNPLIVITTFENPVDSNGLMGLYILAAIVIWQ